jgi:hypothetical protein
MIWLAFTTSSRKMIRFKIVGKTIYWFDNNWKEGIQIMPLDKDLINRMKKDKKMSVKVMAALILDANKGEGLKEYNKCNTEEDLKNMIIKDCQNKGLRRL